MFKVSCQDRQTKIKYNNEGKENKEQCAKDQNTYRETGGQQWWRAVSISQRELPAQEIFISKTNKEQKQLTCDILCDPIL